MKVSGVFKVMLTGFPPLEAGCHLGDSLKTRINSNADFVPKPLKILIFLTSPV